MQFSFASNKKNKQLFLFFVSAPPTPDTLTATRAIPPSITIFIAILLLYSTFKNSQTLLYNFHDNSPHLSHKKRNKSARSLFNGNPSILIRDGVIDRKMVKKNITGNWI